MEGEELSGRRGVAEHLMVSDRVASQGAECRAQLDRFVMPKASTGISLLLGEAPRHCCRVSNAKLREMEQVVYRDEGQQDAKLRRSAADYGEEEGLFFKVSFLESSVKTPKKPQNFSRTCMTVSVAPGKRGHCQSRTGSNGVGTSFQSMNRTTYVKTTR